MCFEFSNIKLLAIDLVENLVKLVFADDDKVGVILVGVFYWIVSLVGRNAAAVEQPLVLFHTDGQLFHILGFQRAVVDILLESEYGACQGCCPFRRVTPSPVIAMRVEVADIGDDWISVTKVGCIVPPFVNPVFVLRVFSSGL